MYQPRIRVSISDPQVIIESDDHWKRKLLILNAASGVTRTAGSLGARLMGPEPESVDTDASVDDEDFAVRESDEGPLELPDPSATIDS